MPDGNVTPDEAVQRWLSVLFDRKMKLKYQGSTKGASILRVFAAMTGLASPDTCLSYDALRPLFQTCVSSISNFRAGVRWNGQVGCSNIIQRTQNQAMCKIAGPFKTTPPAA